MLSRIVQVHEGLVLALCRIDQARDLLKWKLRSARFVNMLEFNKHNQSEIQPASLLMICQFVQQIMRGDALRKTIVFCTDCNPHLLTNSTLMIGGFMTLMLHMSPEEVLTAFEPI